MKPTLEVNETNFDHEVLQAATPVVVDFWAGWCGPCNMLAPTLDEVAREQQGQAVVAKVNVDESPALTTRFNVQSIPTLVYFIGGEERDRTLGVVSKKTITAKLAALQEQSVKAKAA
jgi:thioredoxin 1